MSVSITVILAIILVASYVLFGIVLWRISQAKKGGEAEEPGSVLQEAVDFDGAGSLDSEEATSPMAGVMEASGSAEAVSIDSARAGSVEPEVSDIAGVESAISEEAASLSADGVNASVSVGEDSAISSGAKPSIFDGANSLSSDESEARLSRIRSVLEHADFERDFAVHYQPQVDGLSGALIGVEAFPIFNGELEECSAEELIFTMEELGMLRGLGTFVARNAFGQIAKWAERYGHNMTVTIGLLPQQLLDADFIQALKSLTWECGIEPSQAVLDIANGALLSDDGAAKQALKELQAFGFLLSVSDFGDDNINLAHVLECGFSGIRLSQPLVARAGEEDIVRLVRSLILVSDALRLDVMADGIEGSDAARKMIELGVTSLQGDYYGRPMEPEDLEARYPRLYFRSYGE